MLVIRSRQLHTLAVEDPAGLERRLYGALEGEHPEEIAALGADETRALVRRGIATGLGCGRDDGSGVAQTVKTTETTESGLGGGSIFTMDEITFGLEVCLDHAEEKLKKYYDKGQAPGGERKPQIQLIPSCGMSINAGACVTNLVFNVDARGYRASNDSGATLLTPLTPTKTPTVPGGITITDFFTSEGTLVFYEKQLIPVSTTV